MAKASSQQARRHRRRVLSTLLLLAGLGLGVRPHPAAAQGLGMADAAGTWDLSFEKGNRRCRLTLRPATASGPALLGMPAGCHRAFPLLAGVSGWTAEGNDHVLFLTPDGATVLDFAARGGPYLETTIGEDSETFVLMPADAALRDRLLAAATEAAPPAPAPAIVPAAAPPGGGVMVGAAATATATAGLPPEAMLPPVTAAQVAGNYAVLRDARDTGCMVTLEEGAARGDARAKLAPACRDQGIVIFDPVGWSLAKGELVLTAKRGHKTALSRRQDRNWATAPARGAALVLKRL